MSIKKISIIFFSLIFIFSCLEIGIRFLEPANSHLLFRPNSTYEFKIDTVSFPGFSRSTSVKINKDGYRGELYNSKAKYHILAIGGSTTECFLLNEDKTWTKLLKEKISNNIEEEIWLGNLGKSGLNSQHHIEQLKVLEASFPKIDLVIFLMGINDMLRYLKYVPDFEKLSSSEVQNTMYTYHTNTANSTFPNNFKLVEILKNRNFFYFPQKTINMDIDGKKLNIARKKRFYSKNKIVKMPNIEKALDLYEENILEITNLCKQQGVELLLLTQPYLWKYEMPNKEEQLLWLGENKNIEKESTWYFHTSVLKKCMDRFNSRLKKVAEENSFTFFDLEPRIEKDTTNFYDGMHFNENGAKNVSEQLTMPIQSVLRK